MTTKTKNIINWVLAGLAGILFLGSGVSKIMANSEAIQKAQYIGINASTYTVLGIIEILSVILFLYPRTGVLGTLLLTAFLGGAIATHVEHGFPVAFPVIIEALLWIVAVIRFPELKQRIFNK